MSSAQENTRKLIMKIYIENPGLQYKSIAKKANSTYFTVRNTINRYLETQSVERKPGTGKTSTIDKCLELKVKRSLKQNPNISLRDLAKKNHTNHVQILRIKRRLGIRSFKKFVVPRREDKQQITAKLRSRKLYHLLVDKKDSCLVMDDETYVKANFKSLPGNQYYSGSDKASVDMKFKIIQHEKFPKKFMVWQAICQCGARCAPYITQGTIASENYITECLQKRLLPFLRQHRRNTLFWPDLASCHYSKLTTAWYESNKVNYVPKTYNPPNCPELRPIERYWAIMKSKLRKTTKEAKDIVDFKKKWVKTTKLVPDTSVRAMMRAVRSKVRIFQIKGILL